MKAVEIRDANFEQLRGGLREKLRRVYEAFAAAGPCTTRQLAEATGMDILSVRPRATDLERLGLLALRGAVTGPGGRREGLWAVTTRAEWEAWRRREYPTDSQLPLGFHSGTHTP